MSTQAPVREEQRQDVQPQIVESPEQVESPFVEVGVDAEDGFPIRRTMVLATLGATTLLSVGALLGARVIGRRVKHGRRSIRVKGGSPRLLIMLPFTAINFYGKRSRRFTLPRLQARIRGIRRAGSEQMRIARRLPVRLQHRLAGR